MPPEGDRRTSFRAWISSPEVLIGLSAVLLGVCGLTVSIYQARLARREARASVWPHLEVAASLNAGHAVLWIHNTGVGPARIRAANVTLAGKPEKTWEAVTTLQELVNRSRVVPAPSGPQEVDDCRGIGAGGI